MNSTSLHRLQILEQHLLCSSTNEVLIEQHAISATKLSPHSIQEAHVQKSLEEWLHSEEYLSTEDKQRRKQIFQLPLDYPELFSLNEHHKSKNELREMSLQRAQFVVQKGLIHPIEQRTAKNVRHVMNVTESLCLLDPATAGRITINHDLVGLSILRLARPSLQKEMLPKLNQLSEDVIGCFGLTELGHGSATMNVETTATYDHKNKQFIIHTPTTTAQKYWIGNSLVATHAVVFAQLIDKYGTNQGVHAFWVPLRDKIKGVLFDGITIKDVGHKLEFNGIDNGRLFFNQVRIPKHYFLDKFGQIDDETGDYNSPISNKTLRFHAHINALMLGRLSVSFSCNMVSKASLIIGIRYALSRKQFGPQNGKTEVPLLDHLIHQRRLFPHLAFAYALHFANEYLAKQVQKIWRRIT